MVTSISMIALALFVPASSRTVVAFFFVAIVLLLMCVALWRPPFWRLCTRHCPYRLHIIVTRMLSVIYFYRKIFCYILIFSLFVSILLMLKHRSMKYNCLRFALLAAVLWTNIAAAITSIVDTQVLT